MNNSTKRVFAIFMAVLIFISGTNYASASAWWGEGARSSEWVTSHGGTVLYFEFKGVKGDKKDLKINLYTANGDVIETERGDRKGKIDDGIAGQSYYLKAKDGGKSAKSKVFTMKRGSTNNASVDIKGGKISLSLGGGTVSPKKIVTEKPVIQKNDYRKKLLASPVLGRKDLDYNYLVKPAVGPLAEKGPIEEKPKKIKKVEVATGLGAIGKTSKKKIDYNLAYNYYKVDYKKIRDDKFELKIFTLKDNSQDNYKKLAKNK